MVASWVSMERMRIVIDFFAYEGEIFGGRVKLARNGKEHVSIQTHDRGYERLGREGCAGVWPSETEAEVIPTPNRVAI